MRTFLDAFAFRAGFVTARVVRLAVVAVRVLVGVQRRRPVGFAVAASLLAVGVWPLRASLGVEVPAPGPAPVMGTGSATREFPGRGSWSLVAAREAWWLSDEGAPSTSRYVNWMSDDVAADRRHSEQLGCDAARASQTGPVVLAFGRQVDGGVRGFRAGRVVRPYAQIREVVLGFLDGLDRCGAERVVVAVTTSNYRLEDPELGERLGREWGELVGSIPSRGGLVVTGGSDLEPGWGDPEAARRWVEGYRSAGLPLVANASADGCPQSGASGRCANGWTVELLASLVWGDGGVAVPQIYRVDGAQARQWGVLARAWVASGGVPRFAGAMTQVRACGQVSDRNCPQLSLGAGEARQQLAVEVAGLADVPVGTDIGWG